MFDLHAHILPEIDDGAANLEESLSMCKIAYQDGIRAIVATPHVGKFPNTKKIILEKSEGLREKINSQWPNLVLFSGCDLEFQPNIFSLIENKSVLTINNSRYLLLDIPYFLIPPNVDRLIENSIGKGVIPIIGHPERCLQIQEDLSILLAMVKAGAIIQITASSLTGKMGPKAKEAAVSALKKGLVHVIATDTHGTDKRPPILSEAVEIASKVIGKDAALAMVTTVPESIIEDKVVNLPKPD
jgi:protein-tyrosine phosphatase